MRIGTFGTKKGKKKKKNVTKTLHFQAFDDILVKSSYSFIKPSFVFFFERKKSLKMKTFPRLYKRHTLC